MKKSICNPLAIVFVCLFSGNLIAFEEIGKVQSPLSPMEEPSVSLGDKHSYYSNDKGEKQNIEVTEIGDGVVSVRRSDGCAWQETSIFSPSLMWEDCDPYANGAQSVKLTKGSIWPLKKGVKFRYSVNGKNEEGDSWNTRRSCKVKKEVRVKTKAGEYDTFKVVCRNDWSTYTFYVSPEVGNWVAFKKTADDAKRRRNLELVSVE